MTTDPSNDPPTGKFGLGDEIDIGTWTKAERVAVGFEIAYLEDTSAIFVTWPCDLAETRARNGFLGGPLHLLMCHHNQNASFRRMFPFAEQACFRLHFAGVTLGQAELNWNFGKRIDFFVQELFRVRVNNPCRMYVVVTDDEHEFEGGLTLAAASGLDREDEDDGPGVKIMENLGIAVYVGSTEEHFVVKEVGRWR